MIQKGRKAPFALAGMNNMEYNIIRSNRRSLAVEVKNGEVIVRAPLKAEQNKIDDFLEKHKKWIESHLAEYDDEVAPLTNEEIKKLADEAVVFIPQRVKYYAELIGVTYGRITIRNQKTKWGSCSEKGNLNFNCLLMLAPKEVIDSVVVHELCHRKEMNHSKNFYTEVLRVFPDYRKWDDWLKKNGTHIMRRMR